ncbi:fimbrial subunit [Bordetella trematum]|nr:fimbrial subunit [Bordetella trematum]
MTRLPCRTAIAPCPRPLRRSLRLSLAALLLCSPVAHAVDGTITINGEIIDSTCKINGQNPPVNLVVNLPKIGTSALKKPGDVAGTTAFTLTLTECPSELMGQVKAHFEPGPTTDYDTGHLYAYTTTTVKAKTSTIPAGQASETKFQNVQIQLANSDGSPIKIGAADSLAKGTALQAGSEGKKSATLHYLARYYKSGTDAITAGKLYTYVQYSIVYP